MQLRFSILEELLERKPKELSGGQRQRVALGRAIVRDAKVFLMDEPLSNLDAKLTMSKHVLKFLNFIASLKTTTIYVTHDQTEAMTMATRIVVMKNGLIQQVGTPREIYLMPANVFVGKFIGSPAMNFIGAAYDGEQLNIGLLGMNLPKETNKQLNTKGYQNKKMILGIRPENFTIVDSVVEDPGTFSFIVEVEMAELMGAETLVYFTLNGQQVILKVNDMGHYPPGKKLAIRVDLNDLHFFDAGTEMRIPLELDKAKEEVIREVEQDYVTL